MLSKISAPQTFSIDREIYFHFSLDKLVTRGQSPAS